MKKITSFLLIICTVFTIACSSTGEKKPPVKLKTFQDSLSWVISEDIVRSFADMGVELNDKILSEAIKYAKNKKNPSFFSQEERMAILSKVEESRMKEAMAEVEKIADANRQAGQKYMEDLMAKDPSIKTTPSGLRYKMLKDGKGRHPSIKGRARLNYKGSLINGTTFDNSFTRDTPVLLGVANVIPGFREGIELMNAGAHYIFYVPDNLAYGNEGNIEIGIQPGMLIIYEVELYEVLD